MEGSPQIWPFNQFRKQAVFGSFKLAAILAKFGFNIVEAERTVDIRFGMDFGQSLL